MSALHFARAMCALCAVGFVIAAWRLVVNATEGNSGWVAAMAVCCVMDVALCLSFAKEARR